MCKDKSKEWNDRYAVERYSDGYILCDYSGKRGKFGAAYKGIDGEWRSQPLAMEPFATKADAIASEK